MMASWWWLRVKEASTGRSRRSTASAHKSRRRRCLASDCISSTYRHYNRPPRARWAILHIQDVSHATQKAGMLCAQSIVSCSTPSDISPERLFMTFPPLHFQYHKPSKRSWGYKASGVGCSCAVVRVFKASNPAFIVTRSSGIFSPYSHGQHRREQR